MWIQNFMVADTKLIWRENDNTPPTSRYIGSPYESDARYAMKRGTHWIGYKLRVCQVVCVNGAPLSSSAGKRPTKRIASWLRMRAQSCGGIVHFLVMSRVTRNSNLRAASALGNEPFVFVTLRN